MLFRSSALFLALASSAHAFVFIGNPKLHLEVSRAEADLTGGDAYVDLVRVHACGGGYTDYAVEQWVDPTDGWDTTIAGGDLCGVSVKWGSDVSVQSSTFALRYEQLVTQVPFTTSTGGATSLTPLVVESGTLTGSPPVLQATLD